MFRVWAALLILWARLRARDERAKHPSPLPSLFSRGPRLVLYALVLAVTIIFSLTVVEVPQALGALTIFNAFIICLVLFLTLLDILGRGYGIPFITILVLVAVVASAFELNNNHGIRTWKTSQAFEKPHVVGAFDAWYRSRKDRQFYEDRNQPYPVYIVAARGGGLYAAYHTAKFLARLQDQCPNFAQHTFAISGVSGGSLGGAVFAALTKALKAPNGAHMPCTAPNETRNRDFEKRPMSFSTVIFCRRFWLRYCFPTSCSTLSPIRYPLSTAPGHLRRASKRLGHMLHLKTLIFSVMTSLHYGSRTGRHRPLVLNTTNVETGINHAVMPFMRMEEAPCSVV